MLGIFIQIVTDLGGILSDNVEQSTHLVTDKVCFYYTDTDVDIFMDIFSFLNIFSDSVCYKSRLF